MTDTENKQAYARLKELVDQSAEQTQTITVVHFACASLGLMRVDPSLKDQYIEDYMKSFEILSLQLQAARLTGDQKAVDNLKDCKFRLKIDFAESGIADYPTVQKMYAAKVEENKTNIAYLKEAISLFKQLHCQQIDACSAALGYAYKLEPCADIANDLGRQSIKNNDFDTAISFFEQAAQMETDNHAKANYYYASASLLAKQYRYLLARDYCRKAIELNPAHGRAYVLIGKMYADTTREVYPNDFVLAKTVYYAAIEQIKKGIQADPDVTEEARSLINTYSAHGLSNEEIFFHPDLEADQSFIVGGWINERTMIWSRRSY